MNDLIVVGISDYKIAKTPDTIATYALGSCVGTAIYDEDRGVGGLSHIMLPDSNMVRNAETINRMKFGDVAIVDMVEEIIKVGGQRNRFKAKIAGGANMFETQAPGAFGNIGDRNIESVKKALGLLNIPILAEDTGLNYGRTVFFEPGTGIFRVKSIGKDIKEL